MDENNMHVNERRSSSNVNGSVRRGTTPSNLTIQNQGTPPRPTSLMDSPTQHSGSSTIVQVIVNRDEKGYGMKVSGDNPVYVQSVKPGGAAEKAGLYAGDKIIEVNGENVMSSTHTHVVGLIRSASQVTLTVQQRKSNSTKSRVDSPSLLTRSSTSPSPHQITGPQPVDHEKLEQFKLQKTRQLQLMIEKEKRYLEQLRSQYALTRSDKTLEDVEKTERNLLKLNGTLMGHVGPIEQSPPSFSTSHNLSNEMRIHSNDLLPPTANVLSSKSKTLPPPDVAPPLPKRNRPSSATYRKTSTQYANGLMINTSNNNNGQQLNNRTVSGVNISNTTNIIGGDSNFNQRRDRFFNNQDTPPPLPPRNLPQPRPAMPMSLENDLEAANSISKQMSYPLVATCATIINSYPLNHSHHRTKSSPDSLLMMTPAEASRRLIASESMSDIRPAGYGQNATPPGTPPPPYPNASPEVARRQSLNKDLDMDISEDYVDLSFGSPSKEINLSRSMIGAGDIHAASSQIAQQRIISMEDDEMSDQEVNQLDDHGPFKSLSRLWDNTPHLAVFMNYVLSNSDPNSLLFYLLTDLYKEGNAKDMRKWAYEIHSSFLVPGAPLRLANVEEGIAHEIDDVLMREYDKEEILRKIFWKARNKAKEELTKQLNHFQQKRTAGLGTMYGPSDEQLCNMNHEKARELKIYDTLLVDKLDPYLEEIDKENYDPKKYYTAAALATVIIRIFGVRIVAPLDRFPMFVNKEKSFRTKFMKYLPRKLTVQGHQFNAQQYYTVIVCNHCHQIIYGIGPQGYQCSVCLINLHRTCVKLYDDSCPGPITKKDRGIQKVMEKIGHRGNQKRKSAPHSHLDRKQDEKETHNPEIGDMKPNQSLTRTDSDRRPDAKNENTSQGSQEHIQNDEESVTTMENTKSLPPFTDKKKNASSINRSESVKESSDKQKNERKQQRRNISDPLHNTSESGTIDSNDLPWSGSTGSSSNTSINSNSRYSNESPTGGNGGCDSDGNNETDYLDWQSGLPEEELQKLSSHEKERQDIINELFYTEKSHLRNLDILSRIFLKGIKEKSLLKEEEIQLIFPNLPDLLKIHGKFKCILKNKKIRDGIIWKNIGESLLTMFEGELGETLQKVAATFCENQQCALELIKEKRRKDSKFSMGLNELEKNNDCRRLTLQGFIVSEMQRLAKYPLLIERLISILEKIESNSQDLEYSQVEMNSLTRAHDRAKEIINYINEAAAKAWCKYRLEEIQNHLDTSLFSTSSNKEIVNEFKSIDLTNYNYVYDGPVHLKRQNKAHLQVHMVLLEEFVVLLQRDSERYLLKFFQNGKPGQPPLAPIIKMSTLLVRTNAAFESSLFLVNTSASSMYELLTRDSSERKTWFTHLSNAVESFKQPGGKTKTSEPDEEETVDELPNLQDAIERAETIGSDTSGSDAERNSSSSQVRSTETNNTSSHEDDESTDGKSDITVVEKNDIEINDDVNPKQIKRKGDEVSKAIDEKQNLCADVLNIDRKDFKIIADMTSEANTRDPIDLVIASMNQVDLIFKAVNESLTVTDAELIKGGTTPSCTSQKNFIQNDYHRYPSEMNDVKEAATKLNRLLTELLEVVKDKDEEYLRLRREQEKTREQLHARLSLECSSQEINKDVVDVSADVSQTGDLESIEESLTENDMN
ncbi:rho guanine nucleotide exchange factor 11 isoform X2 [Onthophagus taurus]|uniref:rho guanine nucleotide exchange factor 11 isoform X2 n=1 Tax=Onthophagus taurus TaxID=166361 RepID=UPI0039BEBC7F